MMTNDEYNLYIENYLKNDKTQSAIMLTAPWGMGKSYYRFWQNRRHRYRSYKIAMENEGHC